MTNETPKAISIFELFKLPLFCVLCFCILMAFLHYVPMRFELSSGSIPYSVYEQFIDFLVFNWRNFDNLILFTLLLLIVFAKNQFIGFTYKNLAICILIGFLFVFLTYRLIDFLVYVLVHAETTSMLLLKIFRLTLQVIVIVFLGYFASRLLSKRTDYLVDDKTAYRISIFIYSLVMAVIILKLMQVTIPIKYATVTYSDAQRIAENIRRYKIDAVWTAVFVANFVFVYGWAKQVLHLNMFENKIPFKKIIISSLVSIIFATIIAVALYFSIVYIVKAIRYIMHVPVYVWRICSFAFFGGFIIFFIMLLKKSPLYLKILIAISLFVALIFALLIFYKSVFINFDERAHIVLSFMLFYAAFGLYLTSLCCSLPLRKVFKV